MNETTTNPLIDNLQTQVLAWEQLPAATIPRAMLEHGLWFPDTQPKDYKPQGTPKECFRNAAVLAGSPEYTYCEGYVMGEDIPLAIHHAWVIRRDGVLFDPTLRRREGVVYWYHGVCIPNIWNLLDGYYSAFDATDYIESLGYPTTRWLFSDEKRGSHHG